jgi:hypothetical protein
MWLRIMMKVSFSTRLEFSRSFLNLLEKFRLFSIRLILKSFHLPQNCDIEVYEWHLPYSSFNDVEDG